MNKQNLDLSQHTFLWYDYETFGLDPKTNRIAQFAAVRTNMNLQPIGKPIMLYCRPATDFLPDPEACLITGITPQLCQQQGLPEYQFAQQILDLMAQPNTITVGYNSIRFDEEFTRYLLWRNLHDVYAREWQNGCGRWDLLDVVRLTYALRPEGIIWPKDEQDLPSFKLENLTKANALMHEAAHDALSDVYATISLAKLIQTKQPKLFEFALQLHKKPAVLAQMVEGDSFKPFIHVSGQIPRQQGSMAIMQSLVQHPTNNNAILAWDLTQDPSQLADMSVEQIKQRLFGKTADLPEGVTRLPIKGIHINKSPMVVSSKKMIEQVAQRWQIDLALISENLEKLQKLPEMSAIWQKVYQQDTSMEIEQDVDASLYQGFLDNEDKKRLAKIIRLNPDELAIEKLGFNDQRLIELVFRYRARNFPDSLNQTEQQRWHQHCQQKLLNPQNGSSTIEQLFNKLEQLQQQLDEQLEQQQIAESKYQKQQHILEQLYDWGIQLQENML